MNRYNSKKMVYGSFEYDNRRDHRDEEEALRVINKGCDSCNNNAGDVDDEEEANDIIIATADSPGFKLTSVPFLFLMVVLSCFMLGIDFGIGTTTFSSWLLSSSPSSSSLPLSLSSSSYNNNNKNIDESDFSSTQDVDSVAISTTHNNNDKNIGQCQTTGTYSSVIDYKAGGSILFGETNWGLNLKSSLLSTQTFSPDRCYWHNSKDHNHQCPDSENRQHEPKKIVEAWQQCAEACNSNEKCVTYTATVEFITTRWLHDDAHYQYTCYLHDHYTCSKDGTGVDGSDIDIRDTNDNKGYLNSGYWSGLCRINKCS